MGARDWVNARGSKESSYTRARVWVVLTFLLDSDEGSPPMSLSWEPKIELALAALRRVRAFKSPSLGR
jgi:hypothetical protein